MVNVFSSVRRAVKAFGSAATWFVHSALVHVLAGAALLAVVWSAYDVYVHAQPAPTLPVVYDLSLAYLTGWIFHILVIVLPERRRMRNIVKSLEMPLVQMTAVGKIVLDSLTYIGLCPEREVTLEHVARVCTANNSNDATNNEIRRLLSFAREAYARIEPRLTQLPPDVAKLASDIEIFAEQAGAPKRQPEFDGTNVSDQPGDMRVLAPIYTPTYTKPTVRRQTLTRLAPALFGLYEDCARLRALVERYSPSARKIDMFANPFSDPWVNHKLGDPAWPVDEYPSTAFSDEWPLDVPQPTSPPPMRIAASNENQSSNSPSHPPRGVDGD